MPENNLLNCDPDSTQLAFRIERTSVVSNVNRRKLRRFANVCRVLHFSRSATSGVIFEADSLFSVRERVVVETKDLRITVTRLVNGFPCAERPPSIEKIGSGFDVILFAVEGVFRLRAVLPLARRCNVE